MTEIIGSHKRPGPKLDVQGGAMDEDDVRALMERDELGMASYLDDISDEEE